MKSRRVAIKEQVDEKILKTSTEHRSGIGQGKVKERPVAGRPCFSPQGYPNKALFSHSTVLKFHRIEKTICVIKQIEVTWVFLIRKYYKLG